MSRCLFFIEAPFYAYLELSSVGSFRAPHLPLPTRQIDYGSGADAITGWMWEDEKYVVSADDLHSVTGWCVSNRELRHVEFWAGAQPIGMARFIHPRKDVLACYPEMGGISMPGFATRLHDPLSDHGQLTVRLVFADGMCLDGTIPLPGLPSGGMPGTVSASHTPIRLAIDSPLLAEGTCLAGDDGLVIGGWAIAPDGIESVTVSVDGAIVGSALMGIKRPDVAAEFPDHAGNESAGFAYFLSTRDLTKGDHRVEVIVRSPTASKAEGFVLVRDAHNSAYRRIIAGWRFWTHEAHRLRSMKERLTRRIAFVVTVPVSPDAGATWETLRSIVRQAYQDWRVLLVEPRANSVENSVRFANLLKDERIKVCAEQDLDTALKYAFEDGGGEGGVVYAVCLEPGDILNQAALARMALDAHAADGADLVYCDHDTVDGEGERIDPFFKPGWSPDLLLSRNYIDRAGAVKLEYLVKAAAEARKGAFGSLSWWEVRYRMSLAAALAQGRVVHVDDVMFSLATTPDDAVQRRWGDERTALLDYGKTAKFSVCYGLSPLTFRREYVPEEGVSVSIIIPTAGSDGLVEGCIRSIRNRTDYSNYEIVVLDHVGPLRQDLKGRIAVAADRVVDVDGSFNWSRFNNLGAKAARGRVLLFLNDDTEVITPEWLRILVSNVLRPEVGAVGAKLLYRDGSVQHNGIVLVPFGGGGRHSFRFVPGNSPGYHDLNLVQRNVSAVTGACMAVRREVFDAVGGFDEELPLIHNDSDFCLRLLDKGLINVVCPDARLFHFEAMSRAGLEERPRDPVFWDRWRLNIAKGDRYFSRHLDLCSDDVRIDAEPVEVVSAGGAICVKSDIKRILAVKLDHIGDFVMAIPAFRKLRALFPDAEITLLCGPWTIPIARPLGLFDRIVPFALFSEGSGVGIRKIPEVERKSLLDFLRSELFDLAVDFRASPDTRWVATGAGARITAGFGLRDRTPGLDVMVEWEADAPRAPKHTHMTLTLERLVYAISQVIEDEFAESASPKSKHGRHPLLSHIPAACPVVAVHPFCGQDTRVWPLSYFAELSDLMVEGWNAWIVLLGSAGDVEATQELLGMARYPERVIVAAGILDLVELGDFLSGVDLFIGNNSGPGHIAAANNIRTVGVYSGVVDPIEYGCHGLDAIIVKRLMVCEPCYISSVGECARAMSCLRSLNPGSLYRAL